MSTWADKLSRFTQNAVTKSKSMAEVTRINIEISNYESSLKQLVSEIGQYVVDADLLRDDAAVKEKLERVVELQSRINASKELVENIRKASLCPNCGAVLEPDVNFCPKCGASRFPIPNLNQPVQATCPNCGAPLDAGAVFCANCGQKVN